MTAVLWRQEDFWLSATKLLLQQQEICRRGFIVSPLLERERERERETERERERDVYMSTECLPIQNPYTINIHTY